jgi:hypothetical protein
MESTVQSIFSMREISPFFPKSFRRCERALDRRQNGQAEACPGACDGCYADD